MPLIHRSFRGVIATLVIAGLAACGSETDDPNLPVEPVVQLSFSPASVTFGEDRNRSVGLVNTGEGAVGPVDLVALGVTDEAGNAVPGATLTVSPAEVPTLHPDASRSLTLTLGVPGTVGSGDYEVVLEARLAGEAAATLSGSFSVVRVDGPVIATLEIAAGASQARQGEVLSFTVSATDDQGQPVDDPAVTWRAEPALSGLVTADGEFVAYAVGTTQLIVEAGSSADTVEVQVTSRNAPSGSFQVVWNEPIELRYTSDHWEHGDAAYTGTWGCRSVAGGRCGDALYVWDITVRDAPVLTDSIKVDARVVNDVKVRADGTLAIITHESSNDGLNGITLLDLADPLHPAVITRYSPPALTSGIHNVWIEGDYAYLVVDGSVPSAGLRVLDILEPGDPAGRCFVLRRRELPARRVRPRRTGLPVPLEFGPDHPGRGQRGSRGLADEPRRGEPDRHPGL